MKTTLALLCCTVFYATLRYNHFKGVAWSEWPVYVLNKAFALSALLLMMIHAIQSARGKKENAPQLLVNAWILMLLHAGLSFAILTSAYYPKYFLGTKFTWQAGWSMMMGVVVAVGMHHACRACGLGNDKKALIKTGAFAFGAGVHAMLLGYAGWFQPSTWPGYMVPITLISFASGLIALIAAMSSSRR